MKKPLIFNSKSFTLEELPEIAKQLLEAIGNHKVIAFYGEMGVGKTTLIKQLCKELKVLDPVQSPTFSIVNEYLTQDNKKIYHFDFYRIENELEAYDIGVEEYLYSGNSCLIEWAEKIVGLLPKNCLKITIKILSDNKRKITIEE